MDNTGRPTAFGRITSIVINRASNTTLLGNPAYSIMVFAALTMSTLGGKERTTVLGRLFGVQKDNNDDDGLFLNVFFLINKCPFRGIY